MDEIDKKETKTAERMKEKKKLFLELYPQKICNISATCKAVNISRETYYKWRRKDKKFDRKCKEAEDGLIDMAETQLFKNIRDGKETSLIFFLTNRAPDRWQDRRNIQHSGKIENTGKILVIKVPDEQKT